MSSVWFFADVDGTLLRERYPIPEQVFLAARTFTQLGGKIVLCTGRSPAATQALSERLRITMPGVLCAGAMLYDFQQEQCLWSDPMPPVVQTVLTRVRDRFPNLGMQAFTAKQVYVLQRNELMSRRGIREENVGRVYDPNEIVEPIIKLTLCCEEYPVLEACDREEFDPALFNYGFSNRRFVDIVRQGVSKRNAAERLFTLLGERPDTILAAGDGMTDVPMLRAASYAYVPETAPEAIRAYANLIIPSAESGGIALAFGDAANQLNEHAGGQNP